jgi:hypothetical protein
MTPLTQTKLLIVGAFAAALIGGLWYVRHLGVIAEREKQQAAIIEGFQKDVAKANAVAVELEAKLAEARAAQEKLTKELNDETNRNPVYRSCRVPADGVRLLRRAIQGTTAR